MTRVYVVVEGQTEESFIKDVLGPVLWLREIYLHPISLRGNPNYARVKKDVSLLLKQDATAYCLGCTPFLRQSVKSLFSIR